MEFKWFTVKWRNRSNSLCYGKINLIVVWMLSGSALDFLASMVLLFSLRVWKVHRVAILTSLFMITQWTLWRTMGDKLEMFVIPIFDGCFGFGISAPKINVTAPVARFVWTTEGSYFRGWLYLPQRCIFTPSSESPGNCIAYTKMKRNTTIEIFL